MTIFSVGILQKLLSLAAASMKIYKFNLLNLMKYLIATVLCLALVFGQDVGQIQKVVPTAPPAIPASQTEEPQDAKTGIASTPQQAMTATVNAITITPTNQAAKEGSSTATSNLALTPLPAPTNPQPSSQPAAISAPPSTVPALNTVADIQKTQAAKLLPAQQKKEVPAANSAAPKDIKQEDEDQEIKALLLTIEKKKAQKRKEKEESQAAAAIPNEEKRQNKLETVRPPQSPEKVEAKTKQTTATATNEVNTQPTAVAEQNNERSSANSAQSVTPVKETPLTEATPAQKQVAKTGAAQNMNLEELTKLFSTDPKPVSNGVLVSNSEKAEANKANSQLTSSPQAVPSFNVAAPTSATTQPSPSIPIKPAEASPLIAEPKPMSALQLKDSTSLSEKPPAVSQVKIDSTIQPTPKGTESIKATPTITESDNKPAESVQPILTTVEPQSTQAPSIVSASTTSSVQTTQQVQSIQTSGSTDISKPTTTTSTTTAAVQTQPAVIAQGVLADPVQSPKTTTIVVTGSLKPTQAATSSAQADPSKQIDKVESTQQPTSPQPTLQPTSQPISPQPTPQPASFQPAQTQQPISPQSTPQPTSPEPTPQPTSSQPTQSQPTSPQAASTPQIPTVTADKPASKVTPEPVNSFSTIKEPVAVGNAVPISAEPYAALQKSTTSDAVFDQQAAQNLAQPKQQAQQLPQQEVKQQTTPASQQPQIDTVITSAKQPTVTTGSKVTTIPAQPELNVQNTSPVKEVASVKEVAAPESALKPQKSTALSQTTDSPLKQSQPVVQPVKAIPIPLNQPKASQAITTVPPVVTTQSQAPLSFKPIATQIDQAQTIKSQPKAISTDSTRQPSLAPTTTSERGIVSSEPIAKKVQQILQNKPSNQIQQPAASKKVETTSPILSTENLKVQQDQYIAPVTTNPQKAETAIKTDFVLTEQANIAGQVKTDTLKTQTTQPAKPSPTPSQGINLQETKATAPSATPTIYKKPEQSLTTGPKKVQQTVENQGITKPLETSKPVESTQLQITPIQKDNSMEVKPILEVSQPLTSQTKQESEATQQISITKPLLDETIADKKAPKFEKEEKKHNLSTNTEKSTKGSKTHKNQGKKEPRPSKRSKEEKQSESDDILKEYKEIKQKKSELMTKLKAETEKYQQIKKKPLEQTKSALSNQNNIDVETIFIIAILVLIILIPFIKIFQKGASVLPVIKKANSDVKEDEDYNHLGIESGLEIAERLDEDQS